MVKVGRSSVIAQGGHSHGRGPGMSRAWGGEAGELKLKHVMAWGTPSTSWIGNGKIKTSARRRAAIARTPRVTHRTCMRSQLAAHVIADRANAGT
jgi:hypothetical protein